jgi:hypothetical protein
MVSAFLSYSWDSDEHRRWVLAFATRLRGDGVETVLDQWHLVPGDQLPTFMEKAVRNSDYVLIVCTPRYKDRSERRVGGVGYEGDIITGEVLTTRNERKFIPLLRTGDWVQAAPTWLAGKYHIDLRSDAYGERQYQDLLTTLLGTRATAPPIRQTPGRAAQTTAPPSVSSPQPPSTTAETFEPIQTGKTHTRPVGIARTRKAIDNLLNEIASLQTDAVANAQVSPQRLREIEEAASENGFSKDTGTFPLQLFSSFAYEDAPQEPFTLTFSKLRKGELTDVEMAQRAGNEREYYAKTVANHVGTLLLSDVIRKSEVRDVLAPDAATYWETLKKEAKSLKELGLIPVLILDNPTHPDWVWEWEHPSQDSVYPRPLDLVIRLEKGGRGAGYIADFNDIQVFAAGIAPGESLLVARETFSEVKFRKYRDNVFVKTAVTEVTDSKTLVDLRLTWERQIRTEHNKIHRIRYATA